MELTCIELPPMNGPNKPISSRLSTVDTGHKALMPDVTAGTELSEYLNARSAGSTQRQRREERDQQVELGVYPFVAKYKHALVLSPNSSYELQNKS